MRYITGDILSRPQGGESSVCSYRHLLLSAVRKRRRFGNRSSIGDSSLSSSLITAPWDPLT